MRHVSSPKQAQLEMIRAVDHCLSFHHTQFRDHEDLIRAWSSLRWKLSALVELEHRLFSPPPSSPGGNDPGLALVLEENLIQITKQIRDWALKNKDSKTLKAFAMTTREIRDLDDRELLNLSERALAFIRTKKPALPNLGNDKRSPFTDLHVAFALNIGTLKSILEATSERNDSFESKLSELVSDIERTLDPLITPFAVTEPSLFQDYQVARGVNGRGSDHRDSESGRTRKNRRKQASSEEVSLPK